MFVSYKKCFLGLKICTRHFTEIFRKSISAPELICTRADEKTKINTRKIQKIPNIFCGRKIDVWCPLYLGSVKMFTVHILFWPDLSFLLRAGQMSK